jgi:hypothetical protein
VAQTVRPCACGGSAERQFTPTARISIPRAFRETSTSTWHLPPKGDPAWEGMAQEGTTREQAKPETLRQFIDRNGLIP